MKIGLKHFLTGVLLLMTAFAVTGQEAKIMILDRGDTATLKSAYQDFKAASERWERSKLEVAKKYTFENGKALAGWERVDFSVDFRAVVPHRESSGWGTGVVLTNSNANATWTPATALVSSAPASAFTVDVASDLTTTEKKR